MTILDIESRGTIEASSASFLARRPPTADEVHVAVRAQAALPPFHGRVHVEHIHSGRWTGQPAVTVCIPAKQEEDTLLDCLDAVQTSLMGLGPQRAGIVLLVNNSLDRSAALARDWVRSNPTPAIVCEAVFDEAIADIGHVRRFALDCAAALTAPDGVLLTTDADTLVGPRWAAALHEAARAGEALAYGPIATDDAALAFGPAAIRIARLEAALREAQADLWRALAPGHAPRLGLAVGGANMGTRVSAYRAVGGLPPLAMDEDRALSERMLEQGFRVTYAEDAGVFTSCRLVGRVAGGMAATLAARLAGRCECDRTVLPTRRFALLALGWRVLCGDGDSMSALGLCRRLDVPLATLLPSNAPPGPRWTALKASLTACDPLDVGAAERELARANALRAAIRADAGVPATVDELIMCVDRIDG